MDMTPKEIGAYLENYIIDQKDAKKSIALALHTKYKKMHLDPSVQDDIMPKNILMIGARHLHTVLEKVLEEISFHVDEFKGQKYLVTPELVHEKIDLVVEDQDLSRYIL
jgi:ATP-dependent protease HslVU (ClpYQ) ATPase subunit